MTARDEQIRGLAVFGTWSGLEACGNGILAGAQASLGVFEFGRARTNPLHQLDEDQEVLFCRRALNTTYSTTCADHIEFVGAVAPRRDAQGRCGFLGGGLAVDIDRPGCIGNWPKLTEDIGSVFTVAKKCFSGKGQGSFLRDCPVPPADNDEKFDWSPATREVMLLHWGTDRDTSWDSEVLKRMQAIAFTQTSHQTILVFKTAVAGSLSLQSPNFDEDLEKLNKARSVSGPPAATVRRDSERLIADRSAGFELEERLQALAGRVQALENNVAGLRPLAPPPQPMRPPSLPEARELSFVSVRTVFMVGIAVLLVLILLLGVYFFLHSLWPPGQPAL